MGPARSSRRWSLLLASFVFGLLLSRLLFGGEDQPNEFEVEESNVQAAEHWERRLMLDQKSTMAQLNPQPQAKLDRPRFAAVELGIRDRLLVLLLTSSSLGPSLWTLLSTHLPAIRPLVLQSGHQVGDFPVQAQPLWVEANPIPLLGALANLSLQNSADWFFLVPDRTFINVFQLNRLIQSLQWNSPVALGWAHPEDGGRCLLEAGILLSAPAMQLLVQGRHLCRDLGTAAQTEVSALETCIRLAANLSCQPNSQETSHRWWRMPEEGGGRGISLSTGSIHEQISQLSHSAFFNQSLTVSPLLSEQDVLVLHEHFLHVELARNEAALVELETELAGQNVESAAESWPIGVPRTEKPPNRFQVPVWELVKEGTRFGNNPEQNSAPLEKEEFEDWAEVLAKAKQQSGIGCEEAEMRQAYRRFTPGRGMDFLMDLDCVDGIVRRLQLVRPIQSTKLLDRVPFVKEDNEIAMLIPVGSSNQVHGLRPLLRQILAICLRDAGGGRRIRILVAARGLEAAFVRLLGADLTELKPNCPAMESTLLLLKPDPTGQTLIQLAALDEAVDRFGQQTLFLLLSPFADFRTDFLDRTRQNVIKHFQVFFPIPFAEFNQLVAGTSTRQAEMFLVHKERGRFDADDWSVAALFGADFAWARARRPAAHSLASLFLGQSRVHILRPVEPSLRIRSHPRQCLLPEEKRPCERSRRLALGTRAQLARLLLTAGQDRQQQQQPIVGMGRRPFPP